MQNPFDLFWQSQLSKGHWPIHQADYNNAYLNSTLDETIYIKIQAASQIPGTREALHGQPLH